MCVYNSRMRLGDLATTCAAMSPPKLLPKMERALVSRVAVDAVIVGLHVRNKCAQVVKVQRPSIAQSPAPHVRSEDSDLFSGERQSKLLVDTAVINSAMHNNHRCIHLTIWFPFSTEQP